MKIRRSRSWGLGGNVLQLHQHDCSKLPLIRALKGLKATLNWRFGKLACKGAGVAMGENETEKRKMEK
jgi:hypothetical protein